MISYRNNIIISCVFIVLVGVFCIYASFSILFAPDAIEQGYILINQTNIFVKYSPSFCVGYAGVFFISIPFLFIKNILSLGENYLTADERLKAKMTLATYTLFLPAIFFLILAIYFSEDIKNKNLALLLVVLGVTYVFAKNSYIYFIKTKNIT